jgi:hypothetical protein
MRPTSRSFVIGTLAVSAIALAGNDLQSRPGGVGPGLGNGAEGGQLPIEDQFEQTFPGGQLLKNGTHLRRVWGRQFSWGATPHESAEKFMKKWSVLWGVPFSQLSEVGVNANGDHLVQVGGVEGAGDFTMVSWSQQVRGVPVFRAGVWGMVGNDTNHPMVLAGGTLKALGNFPQTIADRDLSPSTIDPSVYGREALNQFNAPPEVNTPRYVVWAGVDTQTVEPKLAVEFTATGGSALDPANYQKMLYVVDADTGAVLHQESLILHGTAQAQVNALATTGSKAAACNTTAVTGLPYARVLFGSTTVYADATGRATFSYTGTAAQTVNPSTLSGRYFTVQDSSGTAVQSVTSQSVNDGAVGTFQYASTTSQYTRSQIDTYYHANLVRDHLLRYSPSFPGIAGNQTMIIKNGVSGTCNAFYDGNINFYPSGGGCNNTGFATVVHHEYGHHIVSSAGSGQQQYGEGFGDVMGVLLSDESQLAIGFYSSSCTSGLRNAQNTCVGTQTGSSCGTAIHSWGQVLSGCFWDLRNQLIAAYPGDTRGRLATDPSNGVADYRDILSYLATNSVLTHAGQSDIWTDITVDVLTLDDAPSQGGNNNIGDGSPNYNRIKTAFDAHGLTAPALSLFTITSPAAPSTIDPAGGDTIDVVINPVTGTAQAGSQKLFVREGTSGAFTGYVMTNVSGNTWRGTFPATSCNATVQYYFEVKNTSGTAVNDPPTAPAAVFTTTAITPGGAVTVASEDFASTNGGFVVTGTPASGSGGWEWAVPNGRSCNAPSTTSKCFITGKSIATGTCNDVDGGPTILTTPVYDLSGSEAAEVSFQTYYLVTGSGNTADPLVCKVSNNGGTSWVTMLSLTTSGTWATRTYNIADYVALTSNMMFRFEAADTGTDNTLVCGIDNFSIETISCGIEGDLDGDGIVGASDIGIMLLDYGPCAGCPSDLDGSGTVDDGDVSFLLLLFT